MTGEEAVRISQLVQDAGMYFPSREARAQFARRLAEGPIGHVAANVVALTLDRMLNEIDGRDLSLAKLVRAVQTNPATPRRAKVEHRQENRRGKVNPRLLELYEKARAERGVKEIQPEPTPAERERRRAELKRQAASVQDSPSSLPAKREVGRG